MYPDSYRKVSPCDRRGDRSHQTATSLSSRTCGMPRDIAFCFRTLQELQVFSSFTDDSYIAEFAKAMEDAAVLEKSLSLWNARDAHNAYYMLSLLF